MTRVAFITFEYPPLVEGGAGVYAARLVPELVRLGIDLTVFTRRSPRRRGTGFRLRGISKPSWGAIGYWAALPPAYLLEVHERGPFDVIHSNGIADFTVPPWRDSPARVMTVHHLAAEVPSAGQGLRNTLRAIRGEGGVVPTVERLVVKRSDHVIAVSRQTRDAIVRRFGTADGRVTVIHHGVDIPSAISLPLDRDRFEMPRRVVLLSVGRLEYRKGPDILLAAAARLLNEGHDVHVVLAGAGPRSEYEALASALRIADHVSIVGWVDDPQKALLLERCDVFVVPSRLEGFGMTALEAMAAGKPLVSTSIGAADDGLIDEACGGLAESATPEALAAAIGRCLVRLNRGEPVGQRNRARVAGLSWERAARSTAGVYAEVIAERIHERAGSLSGQR